MDFAGKTITRIEESPTDAEYGHVSDDTLLIHFTDGTALRIEGHSYEDVSLSLGEESATQLLARRRAAMGRREKGRLKRLQRREWLSISCDERATRRAAARAKSTGDMAVSLAMRDAMESLYIDHNRMFYGQGPHKVRQRCPNCGERQCENAPVKEYAGSEQHGGFWASASIPIRVVPGTTL